MIAIGCVNSTPDKLIAVRGKRNITFLESEYNPNTVGNFIHETLVSFFSELTSDTFNWVYYAGKPMLTIYGDKTNLTIQKLVNETKDIAIDLDEVNFAFMNQDGLS